MRRFQPLAGQLSRAVRAGAERRVKGSITDADAQQRYAESPWEPSVTYGVIQARTVRGLLWLSLFPIQTRTRVAEAERDGGGAS